MHVLPYKDLPLKPVEISGAKGATVRIAAGPEHGAPNFIMRVFTIEPGGYSPHHSHPSEHEVFFHAGEGEVEIDGETRPVRAGHVAYIPPNALHQIRNKSDNYLVFV